MKHAFASILTVAALLLSACGGGGDSAGRGDPPRSSQKEFEQAQLDFARCMRKHGVDVPDPRSGRAGEGTFVGPAPGTPPSALRAGQKECAKYLARIRPPELSAEDKREFAAKALKFARCMREHGIDMPDPKVDGARIALELPAGTTPGSPRLREAEQACRKYQAMPGRP